MNTVSGKVNIPNSRDIMGSAKGVGKGETPTNYEIDKIYEAHGWRNSYSETPTSYEIDSALSCIKSCCRK